MEYISLWNTYLIQEFSGVQVIKFTAKDGPEGSVPPERTATAVFREVRLLR